MNKRGFGLITVAIVAVIAGVVGAMFSAGVLSAVGLGPPGISSAFINAHECTRDGTCEVNALEAKDATVNNNLSVGWEVISVILDTQRIDLHKRLTLSNVNDYEETWFTVVEGGVSTIGFNGQFYEVSIVFISNNQTILDFDGEITDSLQEGESFLLSEGFYLTIDNIAFPGNIGEVEIILSDSLIRNVVLTTTRFKMSELAGETPGDAYACLDTVGHLFRSSTPCV